MPDGNNVPAPLTTATVVLYTVMEMELFGHFLGYLSQARRGELGVAAPAPKSSGPIVATAPLSSTLGSKDTAADSSTGKSTESGGAASTSPSKPVVASTQEMLTLVQQVAAKSGTEAVRAELAKFGKERISDLAVGDRVPFLDALRAVLGSASS